MSIRNNTDRLKQIPAGTGRVITESGEVANVADLARGEAAINDETQLFMGNVYQSHKRITLAIGETAYFRMNIPAGTVIRGILASATVITGSIKSLLVTGATPGLVLSSLQPLNADRRLVDLVTPTADAFFERLDGFAGGIELDESVAYAENAGNSARFSTNLTGSGLGGIFDNTRLPYFTFTNVGGAACDIIARFIWADVTGVIDHVR